MNTFGYIIIGVQLAAFVAAFWIGTVELLYGACNAKDDHDFDEGGPWLIVDAARWVRSLFASR